MSIFWVEKDQPLPSSLDAENNGLVAAGLDLSPNRLFEAYSKGLFPWFSPGDPVLWWSPNPRMVLNCKDLYISHSLKKLIRKFDQQNTKLDNKYKNFMVSLNLDFKTVIKSCSERNNTRQNLNQVLNNGAIKPEINQAARNSTWITQDIQMVYTDWHYQGHVHSIEVWLDNQIVGGLYGVSIGKCFFGESMFSYVSDTSKVALAYLVAYLIKQGVEWIDCQQETPHLASLGARPISRDKFMAKLASNLNKKQIIWGYGRLRANGDLETNYE